jgi:hypothetical protein
MTTAANDNAMTIVREFSPCGPCLTRGKLTKTTAQFYCYSEWRGGTNFDGPVKKVRRPDVGGHYSRAHIVPCTSCRDHVKTQYPNGYMD